MNITNQEKEMVNKLSLVRDEFIRNKKELSVSIRKDVVSTTLKDIIVNNNTYDTLKDALQKFIIDLNKIGDDDVGKTNK